jgi:hypothetical protein
MSFGHKKTPSAFSLRKVTAIVTCLAFLLWVFAGIASKQATDITRGDGSKPPRYAFATILTGEKDLEFPDVEDPYFEAARLLSFQLLRNPRTRSRIDKVPMLILVTPDVPEKQRNTLAREGATIVPVVNSETIRDSSHSQGWNHDLIMLQLWNLEEYDKIVFLKADSVIFRPIHSIFEDSATATRATINPATDMPKHYMVAAPQNSHLNLKSQHSSGQELDENIHFNDGFFILHPSRDLYRWYISQLDMAKDHLAGPKQTFLDYLHRPNGPMPWQSLGYGWNLKDASRLDYENGLKSINHQWWRPIADDFVGDRIAMSMDEMTAYLNH